MKMKTSDSTKEPLRASPFVLGSSGQNFDFSSRRSPFIGGTPGDCRWTPYLLALRHKLLITFFYLQRKMTNTVW